MKKILLVLIIFILGHAAKGAEAEGRIVFYREADYQGAALGFRIYVNSQVLTWMHNNSYFSYSCPAGDYYLTADRGRQSLTLQVEAGQTYYVRLGFRTGFWKSYSELILVDERSALPALTYGDMRELDGTPLQRPRFRLGAGLLTGAGFSSHAMFLMDNHKESSLSFGGGMGAGVRLGCELGQHFDLMLALHHQWSTLIPGMHNGSASFYRGRLSLTPSGIIPLQGGDHMRLKLGAGPDYYPGGGLTVKASAIPGGTNWGWEYLSAWGYHMSMIWEMNPSRRWTMDFGLRYNEVRHKAREEVYRRLSSSLTNPSGSGIDMSVGFYINF